MLTNRTEEIRPEARAVTFDFHKERDIQDIVKMLREARPTFVHSMRVTLARRYPLMIGEPVGGP